ncbi:hypothetical protein [Peribacillus frigoritolerans]|uniref:hypothetical protein n=1 Tax=Peribacillus frigoritolerans TaxID=450367 RepID=UPI002227EA9C|nr:hypothetical protein [Peribacillus frigoritolerans]MEE3953517.1 hypothetical protein [Peribacillus frigoritolerans]UYY97433.1 hypothetical protein OJ967_18600 [Peribacillus frigoritolerans]
MLNIASNLNKIDSVDKIHKLQMAFIYILFFYTFCYSFIVRLLLGNILNFNLIYSTIPVILMVGYYIFYNNRVNYIVLYFILFILFINIISIIFYNLPLSGFFRFLITVLSPLLLIGIKLERPKYIFTKFLKIYNWLIIANVLFGLIDYALGKRLQFLLQDWLYFSSFASSIQADLYNGIFRLFSLLGHPLTNMLLLIIFISSNLIYKQYFKEKIPIPMPAIYLITIMGAFLCNSKFGIAILLLLFILTVLLGKNKWRNLIYVLACILIVFSSESLRDNVLNRFLQSLEGGDVSNGRFSAIEALIAAGTRPLLFVGKGINYSDTLLQSVSNLDNIEIPMIMFMFDYGIFTTILIYCVMYVIPTIVMIKNRHWYLWIVFSLIFTFANSYNGMATSAGIVQILTFMTMLFLNLSKSFKLEALKNYSKDT